MNYSFFTFTKLGKILSEGARVLFYAPATCLLTTNFFHFNIVVKLNFHKRLVKYLDSNYFTKPISFTILIETN